MQLDGIHHLALAQGDIRRAEDFYTRILGGEVVRRIGAEESDRALKRMPQVWVRLGGGTFAPQGGGPAPPPRPIVHTAR